MHFRLFEAWRLIAAILVMMYHFLRFGPGDQNAFSDMLFRMLPLLDMFFMISGFLILFHYADRVVDWNSYRVFLLKRLARFYPLYLASFLFFIFVGLALDAGLVGSTQPDRYNFAIVPQNLLLLQAWGTTAHLSFNYVSWSLSAEWFCYLLLPVLIATIRFGGLAGLALLTLICIAVLETLTATGVIPFESWLLADTWGAYRAFVDFAIGGLVLLLVRRSRLTLKNHGLAWLAFAAAVGAMLLQVSPYFVLILLALALFIAALVERNNPEGSRYLALLSPVGRVSFGIYVLHPVVETVLLAVVWRFFVEPSGIVGFYQFWIVPMVVTILLAMASDRWFERPINDRIGRLIGRRKGPASPAPVPAAG